MKNFAKYSFLMLFVFLAACSSKSGKVDAEAVVAGIERIVVLPTQTPVEKGSPQQQKERQAGAQFLDSLLRDQFTGDPRISFAADGASGQKFAGTDDGVLGTVQRIGSEFGADAVLIPVMNTFRQRQGTAMSAQTPASTAFAFQLIETSTGRAIWTAQYNETQKGFLENILSFDKVKERGIKWITVEDMVRAVAVKQLDDCPYL